MIGGTVIETIALDDRVWVNCRDDYHPSDMCAVYVERDDRSLCIAPGDALWWQVRDAMWTPALFRPGSPARHLFGPRCGVHYDIRLTRIGYSGAARPRLVAGMQRVA